MLRKIISIRNVGRFLNAAASGDTTFLTCTVIFAPNGRGKTTLCAILRSLRESEPAYIFGRSTLGNTEQPEVRLLLGNGPATFSDGSWDTTMPQLAVFDDSYVTDNVYSGEAVDTAQRRNLYCVIIGSAGVALARRIEELDSQIRQKNADIREARSAFQQHMPPEIPFDEFAGLPEDPAIENKIAETTLKVEALAHSDQIQRLPGLGNLTLPKVPCGLSKILAKTLAGIASDVERQITDHIAAHSMAERGEAWLSEGLQFVRDDDCPFCNQKLTGIDLIEAYRAFFGDAYHGFRDDIDRFLQHVKTEFGDLAIAAIDHIIHQNIASCEFWEQYCAITPPVLPQHVDVSATVTAMRQTCVQLLARKRAAPLETIESSESLAAACEALDELAPAIAAYNSAVNAANTIIAAKKQESRTTDLPAQQATLARLRAQKVRHTPDVKRAYQVFQNLNAEKEALDRQKADTREQLDTHTATVIENYGRSVSRILDRFHADFQISIPTHNYRGGTASSSYRIVINDVPVDLGTPETSRDRPSFKNTLSAGDRSTLALSLFFAGLEHDPERTRKIVVLDDPFNSQDAFRQSQTVQQIKRLSESCGQVIVLSHNQHFLKLLWDRLPPARRKALQLGRVGEQNTTISEWDIEDAVKSRYLADVEKLQCYYSDSEGNPRDVVQKIRPVLEGYCRNLCPSEFTDSKMLGQIIAGIRAAGDTHPLYEVLEDVDDLNAYTRRYHHAENPNAVTEPLDENELWAYVKSTLRLVGYF